MTDLQVDLSKYNNSWYNTGGNALKRFLWYFVNLWFFQAKWNLSSLLKVKLLRLFGAKIGKNVVIKPGVNIKYAWNLTIENQVWIGENVWIDNLDKIEIASNSVISQGAMLLCGNHNYKLTSFDLIIAPILLKEGCWIGAKSIVTSGVTCQSHAVLSVASVAQTNLEAYTVYQGNPAKAIRKRI